MCAHRCVNRNSRLVFNIRDSIISQLVSVRVNNFYQIENIGLLISRYSSSPHSFTVSYLVNTCGLPPQSAISVSKKVHFSTPNKPDAVLTFLKDHGFEKSHIPRLVRLYPQLIVCDPNKSLRPKFDFFFRTFGLSGTQLANSTSLTPKCFQYSLANRIVPCCDFLKSVLLDDAKVVSVLKNGPSILRNDVNEHLAPNIEVLREVGAPHSVISFALTCYPNLMARNRIRFSDAVDNVLEMGFDPSKSSFIFALHATTSLSKLRWDQKVKVYKSWSWSDDDISLAFRKYPICMLHSEKKISKLMDYLVNNMGFLPSTISKYPHILNYSAKRTFPRCTVYRILQLKGLVERKMNLIEMLKSSEKRFLDKFITPFIEKVPQLLNVYHGEMSYSELGFGPEDMLVAEGYTTK